MPRPTDASRTPTNCEGLTMRLLMTTDTVGGVWTYALELAASLQPHGVQIALATMGAPLNGAQREAVSALHNVKVFESRYKLEWMDNPWDDVERAGEWLLDIAEQYRPDFVHLNGYVHGALPWRVPTLMVGHSCVLSWWQAVKGQDAPPEWDTYRELVTQGLRCAGMVVAPTQTMLASLDQHYGPFKTPRVIYNARNPEYFHPGGKGRLIFASGRIWDDAKNLAAVEKVAPKLVWPVYLAGENQSPGGGIALFGNMNYLGRLAQPEIASWFGRASIYVHPARYEPFGLCVLEAALSGCAMVLGDIPSLRELWEDVAVFVDPTDHAALEAAVTELIEDVPLRHQLAAAAQGQARFFSPATMAQEYMAAYGQLLAEGTALHAGEKSLSHA